MESNPLLSTKEKIILETIHVIHESGIHGLSTRDVAKRVGISEPAIFKHFKTKSDLVLAVLDYYSLYDTDVIQSIRTKNLTPVEAIRSFIDTYASYYENYPAITALTQNFDLLQNNVIYSDKVRTILYSRAGFVAEMIEEAKKIGAIRDDVDIQCVSVAILGSLREWCLHWRGSKFSFSLRDRILATLDMLLLAISLTNDERK